MFEMSPEKEDNIKNRPPGVAIIEDRAEIRASLENLIKYTDDLNCTGSFKTMEDALRMLPEICLTFCSATSAFREWTESRE